jgi:hypothetical protein
MPVNWLHCLLGLLSIALTGAEAQERKPAQDVKQQLSYAAMYGVQ